MGVKVNASGSIPITLETSPSIQYRASYFCEFKVKLVVATSQE